MSLLDVLLFASPNGRIDTDIVANKYYEVMNINDTVIKRICNYSFGKEKPMPAQAPFYVLIKTAGDEEIIPCADRESAEYCANAIRQYGYKSYDVRIVMTVGELYHSCDNASYDTTFIIKDENTSIAFDYAVDMPAPLMKRKVRRFYIAETHIVVWLEE